MKFEELSVPQLKNVARSVNLRGHSGMKKGDLVSALSKTHKLLKSGEVVPRGRAVKKAEKPVEGGSLDAEENDEERRKKFQQAMKEMRIKCDEILGGQLPRSISDQVKNLADM